ncbi:helix-turn-helix domain-containing protein [Saccharothrix lopnurensis]|uniref:Helix-turn-helix domain-containing protein n=1 Tax=Saccharothrix lopnurensis TaxID=1670621 RepID=A0ABW1P659_9PSEU
MAISSTCSQPRSVAAYPLPARSRVAAELAERLARITTEHHAIAQLLAELVLTVGPPQGPDVPVGPERMWMPRQVSDAWGVSYDTILDWIRAGELRAVRVGQQYRVPASECERFMQAQIRAASSLSIA